ncbi:MAG TPA: hypothetical protein IAA26_05865 [Candidatus Blautia faecipullorum]|nr:hypothetical protein [Candidatus Blautia faecipullorum]
MKIFCTYKKEYDKFLKEAVEYTIEMFGTQVNIEALEEIELMDIKEFGYDTDGKTYDNGKKILVTSRLYDMLPTLNISQLKSNNEFRLAINTLFHEMGHATDWLKMPRLYDTVMKAPKTREGISALFWLEYLAEKRSSEQKYISFDEYCNNFSKGNWRAYKANTNDLTEENFHWLCKHLAYFMGRTTDLKKRKRYIQVMVNPLLKEFVGETEKELLRLQEELPFDNVDKLRNLYEIINQYFIKFQKAYIPR